MIPILSVPNIQVPPPVETSVFTGQNADAALGRLPVVTVPPAITPSKVADDGRGGGQQPQRQPHMSMVPGATGFAVHAPANGALLFASPYSTPFIAQLFGQFMQGDEGGQARFFETAMRPDGFVDFEELSQYEVTRYMPSFAFRPRVTPQAEVAAQPQNTLLSAAQPSPAMVALRGGTPDLRQMEVASNDLAPRTDVSLRGMSLRINGPEAYGATQSRNRITLNPVLMSAVPDYKPVSLIL